MTFVAYDLGAAVAAGFVAKYPTLIQGISLLSPLGIKYQSPLPETRLRMRYMGEYTIYKQILLLAPYEEEGFFDRDMKTTHRYLIDRSIGMVCAQICYPKPNLNANPSCTPHSGLGLFR